MALFGHAGAARRCPFIEVKRTSQLRAPKSENDPTETSSGIGPAINLKTAKTLVIDIPLLGRAAFCSLDGLRAQPHDAVSAFTGSVN